MTAGPDERLRHKENLQRHALEHWRPLRKRNKLWQQPSTGATLLFFGFVQQSGGLGKLVHSDLSKRGAKQGHKHRNRHTVVHCLSVSVFVSFCFVVLHP